MVGRHSSRVVLQSESDFGGAAKLREYVRGQTLEFDSLFANVREAEVQCKRGQLANVVAWEQHTHAAEWRALGTAIRNHYTNRRVRSYPCIWCIMEGTSTDRDDRLKLWMHRHGRVCWTAYHARRECVGWCLIPRLVFRHS